jgi:hypothetical protein
MLVPKISSLQLIQRIFTASDGRGRILGMASFVPNGNLRANISAYSPSGLPGWRVPVPHACAALEAAPKNALAVHSGSS